MALATALATYAIAAAAGVAPEPVEPHPAELELRWTAPAGCPDDEDVRERIEALLTGPPRGEGVMKVAGSVTEAPSGFRLVLATDFDGHAENRELSAEACADLGEATAILLAFALEPELAGSMPESALARDAEPEPEPESAPVTTVPEPTVRESQHEERMPEPLELEPRPPSEPPARPSPGPDAPIARPSFFFRLGGAVELGVLPGVSGGPRVALGVGWTKVRIDLHGAYLLPRRDPASGPGAEYQAGLVGLRGCALPTVGDVVTLPVCAGIEGGAVRAATREFDPARTRHGPWLGPLASVGAALRFGRVGLWTAVEAVGAAYSGEFRIAGAAQHTSAPVSGRLAIGAELIVP